MPVIFESGGETDGRKQHGEAGARRSMLRKAGQVNQAGHDEHSAADAEHAGRDAGDRAD